MTAPAISPTMIDVLQQAQVLADSHMEKQINMIRPGWFIPQHHECAKIAARWQTCEALRRRGLLNWSVTGYHKHRGKWFPEFEYKINAEGRKVVALYPVSDTSRYTCAALAVT